MPAHFCVPFPFQITCTLFAEEVFQDTYFNKRQVILVGIRQLCAGIAIFIPVSLLLISHPRASTMKLIKNLVGRVMVYYTFGAFIHGICTFLEREISYKHNKKSVASCYANLNHYQIHLQQSLQDMALYLQAQLIH